MQTPIQIPRQDSKDSVFVLYQPYEGATSAISNGLTAVTLGPFANPNDQSSILRVEVPDGQAIRYEANPPSRSAVASGGSPILTGIQHIMWGPGWTLSFIDAAGT